MAFWLRVLGAGLLAVLLVGGVWWWQNGGGFMPMNAVGRGEPLPAQSHARIAVVEEGVPLAMGVASTSAVIGEPAAGVSATVEADRPLDDVTGLKLGTTLSLLTQAYANGGTMARSLANTAADLAKDAGNRDLYDAVVVLRQGTPLTGPMTVTALVAEGQHVMSFGVPKDMAVKDASGTLVVEPAPAATSWWQRQIEKFVTIRRGDAPTADQWTRKMLEVEQQLARGHASDAKIALEGAPLAKDDRLDVLRGMVKEYLDQQTALTNAMNAYVRTYLAAPEEGR